MKRNFATRISLVSLVVGTDSILQGCSPADIDKAKALFLRFSGESVLEKTQFGEVLSKNSSSSRIVARLMTSDWPTNDAKKALKSICPDETVYDIETLPSFLAHQVMNPSGKYHGVRLIVIDSVQGHGLSASATRKYRQLYEFCRQCNYFTDLLNIFGVKIMFKKSLIILFFNVFFIFALPFVSSGFNYETRKSILSDAIDFCPQDLQTYLNKQIMIESVGNWESESKYLIEIDKMKYIYDIIIKRVKTGQLDDELHKYNAINSFFTLANYILDIVYFYHNSIPYINSTSLALVPNIVIYDGFDEIQNITSRIATLKEKGNQYRNNHSEEIIGRLYEMAFNEVVDFWMSAWKAARHNIIEQYSVGSKIKHISNINYNSNKKTSEQIEITNYEINHENDSCLDLMDPYENPNNIVNKIKYYCIIISKTYIKYKIIPIYEIFTIFEPVEISTPSSQQKVRFKDKTPTKVDESLQQMSDRFSQQRAFELNKKRQQLIKKRQQLIKKRTRTHKKTNKKCSSSYI